MKNVNNGWLQVQITARSAGTPIPPYAVPEAVRVRRLSHDVVLIEFRYRDGEEPIREQELDDRVSMYIGR